MSAKITNERVTDTLAVGHHHADQCHQSFASLLNVWIAVGGKGLFLHRESGCQLGDGRVVVLSTGGRVGNTFKDRHRLFLFRHHGQQRGTFFPYHFRVVHDLQVEGPQFFRNVPVKLVLMVGVPNGLGDIGRIN